MTPLMRRSRSPWWMLALVLVIGALLGSVIAEAVEGYQGLSLLARDLRFGLDPPATLDLRVITVTFGTTIRLNLAILIGIVVAVWIFRMLQ